MNGYALSGTDMTAWAGQRVQVVGTIVPPSSGPSAGSATPTFPELRVQSVQPVSGPCPQR
jgi:hypothetical protein